MEKTFCVLTGASGHVGYALLKELIDKGENVRILLRKDSDIFNGIECEKVFGDVGDIDSLFAAFEGADVVYHFAGVIDVNTGNDDLVWEVNWGGTKNVVEACKKCGVRRLVYASSVDAYPPLYSDQEMSELSVYSPDVLEGTYAKTKATATQYILDECANSDFDAVVIQPSACIGPYDFKVSNVGEMVRMFMAGKFPVNLSFGGYNFVDVRDVAAGSYLAAKKGRRGECYLLSGEALSVSGLIEVLSEKMGSKVPRIRLSYGFVNSVAPLMETYYKMAKKTPLITRYSLRKLMSNCNFTHKKATEELGYQPMSAKQSLCDMVDWIEANA